jgi:hypothetical protein
MQYGQYDLRRWNVDMRWPRFPCASHEQSSGGARRPASLPQVRRIRGLKRLCSQRPARHSPSAARGHCRISPEPRTPMRISSPIFGSVRVGVPFAQPSLWPSRQRGTFELLRAPGAPVLEAVVRRFSALLPVTVGRAIGDADKNPKLITVQLRKPYRCARYGSPRIPVAMQTRRG